MEEFNPNAYVRNIAQKDKPPAPYLDTQYRILWFRSHHPTGAITTETVMGGTEALAIRATVFTGEGVMLATGLATLREHKDKEGKRRDYEKAETAAIGRALAHAGYDIVRPAPQSGSRGGTQQVQSGQPQQGKQDAATGKNGKAQAAGAPNVGAPAVGATTASKAEKAPQPWADEKSLQKLLQRAQKSIPTLSAGEMTQLAGVSLPYAFTEWNSKYPNADAAHEQIVAAWEAGLSRHEAVG